MDRVEAEQTIRKLKADRDAAVAAAAEPFDAAISGLQTLLTHLRTQQAVSPSKATPKARRSRRRAGHPRGVEAVRQVLVDTREEMGVREIVAELEQRGWRPESDDPVNATSSSASRAVQQFSDVVRRRSPSGAFIYRYENPADQAGASSSSNGSSPTDLSEEGEPVFEDF